jgi:hypothetical protein
LYGNGSLEKVFSWKYNPSSSYRKFLHDRLPERWIGGAGPIPWPPRSPDITPLNFFFCGYVKDCVSVPPLPVTLPELQNLIRESIASVTMDMLYTVCQESEYKPEVCRITSGAHMGYL